MNFSRTTSQSVDKLIEDIRTVFDYFQYSEDSEVSKKAGVNNKKLKKYIEDMIIKPMEKTIKKHPEYFNGNTMSEKLFPVENFRRHIRGHVEHLELLKEYEDNIKENNVENLNSELDMVGEVRKNVFEQIINCLPRYDILDKIIELSPELQNLSQKLPNIVPEMLWTLDAYVNDNLSQISVDEDLKKPFEDFFRDLFSKKDFCICFHINNLEKIKSEGFLNVVEKSEKEESLPITKHIAENRKKTAEEFFGVNRDSLLASDYEKYGYLSEEKTHGVDETVGGYGNVKAVLDKDKIKDRTTFTFCDSLDNSSQVIASKVSNPSILSIPGVKNDNWDVCECLLEMIEDSDNPIANKNVYQICNELESKLIDNEIKGLNIPYLELQFHGPIPFSFVKSLYDLHGKSLDNLL